MNQLRLLGALSLLVACPAPPKPTPAPPDSGPGRQRFPGRGVVRSLSGGQLVLQHDAIPGLMPAMTMPLPLASPGLATGLAPGDVVAFQLDWDPVASSGALVSVERLGAVDAGAQPAQGPTALAPLQAGDAVPRLLEASTFSPLGAETLRLLLAWNPHSPLLAHAPDTSSGSPRSSCAAPATGPKHNKADYISQVIPKSVVVHLIQHDVVVKPTGYER